MIVPSFIIVFVVLGVTIVVFAYLSAARRASELAGLARRLGLRFESLPGAIHSRYGDFTPFGRGGSRRSHNLLTGSSGGLDWEIFDYQYTTGSGDSESTDRWGIVAATLPVHLPAMTIRPEGFFDKLKQMAGFDDINFESEAFSRRYFVNCNDRKLAYDLIHPQMIEFFLQIAPMHWQFAGRQVLLIQRGRCSVAEIERYMGYIEGFAARIPDYVRQDRRTGA